jgi:hypothetical protein
MSNSFHPPQRTLLGPGPSDVSPRVLAALGRPTIGHLAQNRVDHALHVLTLAVRRRQGDRIVDHAMRITAQAQLDRGKAQDVAHVQRRRLAQVPPQQAVGALQPAQGLRRQPLGTGPFRGVQPFDQTGQVRHQPALAQHLV